MILQVFQFSQATQTCCVFGRFISVSYGKQMAKDRNNSVLLFALHLNTYINGIHWLLKTFLRLSTSSYERISLHTQDSNMLYVCVQTNSNSVTYFKQYCTNRKMKYKINICTHVNYPLEYGSKIIHIHIHIDSNFLQLYYPLQKANCLYRKQIQGQNNSH